MDHILICIPCDSTVTPAILLLIGSAFLSELVGEHLRSPFVWSKPFNSSLDAGMNQSLLCYIIWITRSRYERKNGVDTTKVLN